MMMTVLRQMARGSAARRMNGPVQRRMCFPTVHKSSSSDVTVPHDGFGIHKHDGGSSSSEQDSAVWEFSSPNAKTHTTGLYIAAVGGFSSDCEDQKLQNFSGRPSDLICKVTVSGLPDPNISGLESSEQISSVHAGLQEFSPHLKRVLEQQTDLQLPESLLLKQLHGLSQRSQYLDIQINKLYQELFPNSPPLVSDPSGGATSLPPPQTVFQQKIYGCMVLKTYKEFLSNVSRYLRTLKAKRVD
ncbi:hypothetical protein WMY93_020616 [Mugilogobius chulae]|uniref:Ciliary neurotrophic factor n=1 Tax=Mugilogobius chulae TaxID=88201 RepID=A0AAW0NE63_9GOBI